MRVRIGFVFGPSVFVSVPPASLSKRRAGAFSCRGRSGALRPTCRPRSLMSAKKGSAVHGQKPEDARKRQADRSDVRQRIRPLHQARTGFGPMDKRTGASPSCLRVSHNPCLRYLSLRFRRLRGGCGRFPSGALRTPFIQRPTTYSIAQDFCKENSTNSVTGKAALALIALPKGQRAWPSPDPIPQALTYRDQAPP